MATYSGSVQVDITSAPYGLTGGIICSNGNSSQIDGPFFCIYPLAGSSLNVTCQDIVQFGGTNSFPISLQAGIPFYGRVNSVVSGTGTYVLYRGPAPIIEGNNPNQFGGKGLPSSFF